MACHCHQTPFSYENATEIYYLHDGYTHQSDTRLVEITNDGMSGIAEDKNGNTTQVMLESVFEQIPLY